MLLPYKYSQLSDTKQKSEAIPQLLSTEATHILPILAFRNDNPWTETAPSPRHAERGPKDNYDKRYSPKLEAVADGQDADALRGLVGAVVLLVELDGACIDTGLEDDTVTELI